MVSLTRKISNRALNWLLSLFVLSIAAYFSLQHWIERQLPPVKFLSAAAINHTVVPGGDLIIRVTFDRRANCPGVGERFILSISPLDHSEAIVYRDTVQLAPTTVGEAVNYTFMVPIPVTTPPGDYVFRGDQVLDCNGKKFNPSLPEVGFTVKVAKDK